MKFRLTYEGPVEATQKNDWKSIHRHEIRRAFHKQLKFYWQEHSWLNKYATTNYENYTGELLGLREYHI